MTDLLRPDQLEGYLPNLNNLLTNGDFEIWQRGASFPISADDDFTADEWRRQTETLGTMSVDRSSDAKVGAFSAEIDTGGVSLSYRFVQGVESYKSLEGLFLTFSAWIKTSVPNRAAVIIADWTGIIDEPTSAFHIGDGNWHRMTITKKIRTGLVASPAGPHSFGIHCGITTAVGTTGIVRMDGATLVIGNFPQGVPFIPILPSDDWNRCLRYYYKAVGQQHARSVNLFGKLRESQAFPQVMAATPTVIASNLVTVPGGGAVIVAANDDHSYDLEFQGGVADTSYTFDLEAEVS